MRQELKIGKEFYNIELHENKELIFSLYKYDPDLLSDSGYTTQLTENAKDAYSKLNKIINKVIEMIYDGGINYFTFTSYSPKQVDVYKKLIARVIQKRSLPFEWREYNSQFTVWRIIK